MDESQQIALSDPGSAAAVIWKSLDPAIATVSSSGVVLGRSIGTTAVVAYNVRSSDTATVSVHAPIASLRTLPDAALLGVGQSIVLSPQAYDKTGKLISGLTMSSMKWSSSAPEIATVSSTGVVQAVSLGTATISVVISGRSAMTTVQVQNVPVAAVEVSPSPSVNVVLGGTAQLVAVAKDSSGNNLSNRAITWSSSDPSVVGISQTGAISGQRQGTATVSAVPTARWDRRS